MKLVLEGGGVRAAYAAGVLESLADAGVRFDAVIGSSSGTLNAAFWCAGQMKVACDVLAKELPGNRFISYRRQFTPWGRPGLDVDWFVDDLLPSRLDHVRATSGDTKLFWTVSDIDALGPHVVSPTRETFFPWLRAALALPVGYNRVVTVDGRRCIDGGVAAPVPFDADELSGFSGPTVIVLTRPIQREKPPPVLWERLAVRLIVPPGAREMSATQHHLHNALMRRLEAAVAKGDILLVDPPADMPLSRLTRDETLIKKGIDMGRDVGRKLAPKLLAMR